MYKKTQQNIIKLKKNIKKAKRTNKIIILGKYIK